MSLSPERAGRLTASVFASAIGIGYDSRQKLWRQLTGREEAFAGNEATQWGQDHEQFAIDEYEYVTGNIVVGSGDNQQFIMLDDWLGCTPDGIVDNKINVEVKCPFSLRQYFTVPAHYMPQIQGQMAITGTKLTHFICWTPDEIEVYEVFFNVPYWQQCLELLTEFWEHVKTDTEPKRKKKPTLLTVNFRKLI
jgi:putative phage-type endonuclease